MIFGRRKRLLFHDKAHKMNNIGQFSLALIQPLLFRQFATYKDVISALAFSNDTKTRHAVQKHANGILTRFTKEYAHGNLVLLRSVFPCVTDIKFFHCCV